MRVIGLLLLCPLVACVVNTIPIADDGEGEADAEGSTTSGGTTTYAPTPPLPSTTGPGTISTTGFDDTGVGSSEDTGGGTGGLGEDCSLELQDCAEGLKCMPYSNDGGNWWNDVACFPIDPDPVGVGEPCEYDEYPWSGHDNCGDGQVCWSFNEDGTGECKEMCTLTVPGDWDTLHCEQPEATPYIGCQSCFCVCEISCDPLLQNCDDGEGCYLTGSELFLCYPEAPKGTSGHGEPCEYINACAPGTNCIDASVVPSCEDEGAFGCCSSFCDTNAPNTCPGADLGEECVPLFDNPKGAPVGLDHVGQCAAI